MIEFPEQVYEIGQAYLPFYFILAHEIVHLNHFLENSKYKNIKIKTGPSEFVSFWIALRIKNYQSLNLYFGEDTVGYNEIIQQFPEYYECCQMHQKLVMYNSTHPTNKKLTYHYFKNLSVLIGQISKNEW